MLKSFHTMKKSWSSEEDAALLEIIAVQGAKDWSTISAKLQTRSAKQCRERYHNHLQPNIKKGGWSAEEDNIIFTMQPQVGNQWAKIAKFLPGRTDNAVKNRWHAVIRNKYIDSDYDHDISSVDSSSTSGRTDALYSSDFSSSGSSMEIFNSPNSSSINISRKKSAPVVPTLKLDSLAASNISNNNNINKNALASEQSPFAISGYIQPSMFNNTWSSKDSDLTGDSDLSSEDEQSNSLNILVDSGRSDSTFNEILGELANSFQNQMVGDSSDLFILGNLSARSDLMQDDVNLCATHNNSASSEQLKLVHFDLGCFGEVTNVKYDSQSPRPWWEGDVFDDIDAEEEPSPYFVNSARKPRKGGLTMSQFRSPRSPAIAVPKKIRS
jgi:hypothetical protein